jgi:uncharacterized protein YbjQ (UPF0145 family)
MLLEGTTPHPRKQDNLSCCNPISVCCNIQAKIPTDKPGPECSHVRGDPGLPQTKYVNQKIQTMILSTTHNLENHTISEYLGIVTGETIIGANIFKDFFAGIRDVVGGRSGSYERVLREAKDNALSEMAEYAKRMGADAVIGIDLDYETIGSNGSMIMVTASGTAVKF